MAEKEKEADVVLDISGKVEVDITSAAYVLLDMIDNYVTAVQNKPYARRMSVALFWSAASLFYLVGDLEMKKLWLVDVGDNLTHQSFCAFLLIMTLYFTVMFGFVFLKIWLVSHPAWIFGALFRYRKMRARPSKQTPVLGKRNDAEDDLALWEIAMDMKPGVLRDKTMPKVPDMKSQSEIRNFMVHRAFMGLLENLFARMLFPMLLCIAAVVALVLEIWPKNGRIFAVLVSIFLVAFLAKTIYRLFPRKPKTG